MNSVEHYIISKMGKSFSYGDHDCLTFCNGFLKIKEADNFLGRYKNRREYFLILKNMGFRSISDFCNSLFNRVELTRARRGSLMFYKGALGLCTGYHSFFLSQNGLAPIKTIDCCFSWDTECRK